MKTSLTTWRCDASEAYLGDFVAPLKRSVWFGWFYRRAERRLMRAICERYSLPYQEPESVKRADRVMLLWERRDLMGPGPEWGASADYADCADMVPGWRLEPLSARDAEAVFLRRYDHIKYEQKTMNAE